MGINKNRDEGVEKNMRDMKKIFYYYELLRLGVSAMPQPTGYGDDDGDDKVLMVMWRMIIIIIFHGMKKRKAGSTNSPNTIIIVKKIE